MYSHFYFSFIIFLNQLCKEMWHWTTMNLKFKHELPSNLVQYPQYLYCRLLISTLKWFSRYLVTHLFIFLTSLRKTFEHELGFLNFVSRTSYKIQTVNFTFTNHFYTVYNLFSVSSTQFKSNKANKWSGMHNVNLVSGFLGKK